MAKRTNAYDPAPGLLHIIETVTGSEHPILRLKLARQFSGHSVNRLIESGRLREVAHRLVIAGRSWNIGRKKKEMGR